MRLSRERDSLEITTKKLGRDLAKLEQFKRQLMQSLNDDTSIVEEAGGTVTRMDGGKFCVFDRSILVSNGALHEKG
ncbi:hypothetical protein ACB094_05G142200 [Castanea mollissima]